MMTIPAKFNAAMSLRLKFNLVILAACALGFLLAAVLLNGVITTNAREQVLQNARVIMSAANAIRSYTAQEIVPVTPMERDGNFVPQTVPAYAAQKNFKAVHADFTGFSYREPTLNPTNLSDRAQDWEADIIGRFRNDSTSRELIVVRDTAVGPTLNLAHPITVRDDACLTCHSTPSAAPAALTRSYGNANGFGWKMNETVGAQLLTVPMEVPLKLARDTFRTFMLILLAIFATVFVVLNLLLHYLVIAPVNRLSAIADAVSMGEENVETYIKPGKDEISSLSVSFNRMRESLKHAMDMIR